MKKLAIYFAFDNNYVIPAAVALWSLLDRTKEGVFWEMWVLHHDISVESQHLLQNIVVQSGKGELKFQDTGDFLAEDWSKGHWDGHQRRTQFTRDTVIKCFPAHFFKSYDKIIYSDVDVVFADDISNLWNVDISSVYIAGVKDAFLKFSAVELSHLKDPYYGMLKDTYLAGGIWVMNLKKIRDENLEQRMIEIVQDPQIEKRWPDQDVMNIACVGKVKFLPLNYIGYPYLREYLAKSDFVSHYSRDALYDSILHPKIIHYAGRKPWNLSGVGYDEEWWTIADYLGLDCRKPIRFAADRGERIERKLRLYKRRFRCALVVAAVSSVLLAAVLLKAVR